MFIGYRTHKYFPDKPDMVEINGEIHKYQKTKKLVIQNRKNRQYCIFLGLGMNSYNRVQPIKKSGELSTRNAYFSIDTDWNVIGEIEYCISFKIRELPDNKYLKLISKYILGDTMPAYEWTQNIVFWPREKITLLNAYIYGTKR